MDTKETGKCYIGQSIQEPNQRRLEHLCNARHSPRTYHFANAIKKYGVDMFDWEVLDYANTLEQLNDLEEKYIAEYDSIKSGYNIREGGNNKLHSEESKQRMSEAQKEAHARRRANGSDTFKKHVSHLVGSGVKNKKAKLSNRATQKGRTWKLVDGKRTWMETV